MYSPIDINSMNNKHTFQFYMRVMESIVTEKLLIDRKVLMKYRNKTEYGDIALLKINLILQRRFLGKEIRSNGKED